MAPSQGAVTPGTIDAVFGALLEQMSAAADASALPPAPTMPGLAAAPTNTMPITTFAAASMLAQTVSGQPQGIDANRVATTTPVTGTDIDKSVAAVSNVPKAPVQASSQPAKPAVTAQPTTATGDTTTTEAAPTTAPSAPAFPATQPAPANCDSTPLQPDARATAKANTTADKPHTKTSKSAVDLSALLQLMQTEPATATAAATTAVADADDTSDIPTADDVASSVDDDSEALPAQPDMTAAFNPQAAAPAPCATPAPSADTSVAAAPIAAQPVGQTGAAQPAPQFAPAPQSDQPSTQQTSAPTSEQTASDQQTAAPTSQQTAPAFPDLQQPAPMPQFGQPAPQPILASTPQQATPSAVVREAATDAVAARAPAAPKADGKAEPKSDAKTKAAAKAKDGAQPGSKTDAAPEPAPLASAPIPAEPATPTASAQSAEHVVQPPVPHVANPDAVLAQQTAQPAAPGAAAPNLGADVQVSAHHHASDAATPFDKLGVTIAAKSLEGLHQFDIRLDPVELGRVDVQLTVDSAGQAQANLVVDNPKTLELLQRDASSLNRALTDAGLNLSGNGLNFSLREQQRDNGGSPQRSRGRGLSVNAAIAANATRSPSGSYAPNSVRLDIRV